MEISTSYPYLSIAKHFGIDYAGVLLLAEGTKDKDISLHNLLGDWDAPKIVAADFLPRQVGPILDMLNQFDGFRTAQAVGQAMDDAAELREFVELHGMQHASSWDDPNFATRGHTLDDEIPF